MAKPRQLFVEGNDDVHVVANLCRFFGISVRIIDRLTLDNQPEMFEIVDKKGISNLLESLSVELKASGLEILGIIVDADTDLLARWDSLSNILSRAGYKVPRRPGRNGIILRDNDLPTVGIWLMPDNRLPGMLEDFVSYLIPEDDSLWPYAQASVRQLPEQRFPTERVAKANIHTWLAWQEQPGRPLGLAITARYLNPDSEHAQRFVNWLRDLYS